MYREDLSPPVTCCAFSGVMNELPKKGCVRQFRFNVLTNKMSGTAYTLAYIRTVLTWPVHTVYNMVFHSSAQFI